MSVVILLIDFPHEKGTPEDAPVGSYVLLLKVSLKKDDAENLSVFKGFSLISETLFKSLTLHMV